MTDNLVSCRLLVCAIQNAGKLFRLLLPKVAEATAIPGGGPLISLLVQSERASEQRLLARTVRPKFPGSSRQLHTGREGA